MIEFIFSSSFYMRFIVECFVLIIFCAPFVFFVTKHKHKGNLCCTCYMCDSFLSTLAGQPSDCHFSNMHFRNWMGAVLANACDDMMINICCFEFIVSASAALIFFSLNGTWATTFRTNKWTQFRNCNGKNKINWEKIQCGKQSYWMYCKFIANERCI